MQSPLTPTGDVVLDAKVSIWAPWVVTGCEDNTPHCLHLADHTGDCWSGHDAILTDNQMANLQKVIQNTGTHRLYTHVYTNR